MSTDISKVFKDAKESDEILNATIQAYLDGEFYISQETTVAAWRIENFKFLRSLLHPDIADIEDARYKISEGDPAGQVELDALYAQKRASKLRFPKE